MKKTLHLVKPDGEDFPSSFLDPLLRRLFQAFLRRAKKIKISFLLIEPQKISLEYSSGPKIISSIFKVEDYPIDMFMRLKIFSGMSITQEAPQTGKMLLRFGDTLIEVVVEAARTTEQEMLVLKPNWAKLAKKIGN